jgi:hypothetical protein
MKPQEGMPPFNGAGVMFNFKVDDVDAEHLRLTKVGLQTAMPLEDHPWDDRGFSIIDPIGNSVYIYIYIPTENLLMTLSSITRDNMANARGRQKAQLLRHSTFYRRRFVTF